MNYCDIVCLGGICVLLIVRLAKGRTMDIPFTMANGRKYLVYSQLTPYGVFIQPADT